jgi:predicted RNase H-like HicB family nuclease
MILREAGPLAYAGNVTEEEGKFVVRFPDCDGCFTQGDTREEALAMAEEALNSWLAAHLDLGRVPPRPKADSDLRVAVGEELGRAIAARWATS